ncbi:MAG: hypothetical protein JW768_13370 [Chitinispirillaceae bacterium]|nr:hypothetical protein [Chitinispirillaceae bacterium]
MAVGDSGIILTSDNGENWESCSSGTNKNLASIAWTGEKLVAVGDSGTIITSEDCVVWTKQQPPRLVDMVYVLYASSKILSLTDAPFGPSDTILISSQDGLIWNTLPLTAKSGKCVSIAWNGSQYIAVGDGGTIVSSNDGQVWTWRLATTDTYLNSIAANDSQFVSVGVDTWSKVGIVYISSDGINWNRNRALERVNILNYVTWQGDLNITVGDSGTILTSPDAEPWTPQTSSTTRNLRCVTFTGTQYVAVGDSGTIITSPAENSTVTRKPVRNKDAEGVSLKHSGNILKIHLPYSLRGSTAYVFSLSGKRISTLSKKNAPASFVINTRDLAPGVYQLMVEKQGIKTARLFAVGR